MNKYLNKYDLTPAQPSNSLSLSPLHQIEDICTNMTYFQKKITSSSYFICYYIFLEGSFTINRWICTNVNFIAL